MNKMKRILTIVLTLALIVTMMPMNLTNVKTKLEEDSFAGRKNKEAKGEE